VGDGEGAPGCLPEETPPAQPAENQAKSIIPVAQKRGNFDFSMLPVDKRPSGDTPQTSKFGGKGHDSQLNQRPRKGQCAKGPMRASDVSWHPFEKNFPQCPAYNLTVGRRQNTPTGALSRHVGLARALSKLGYCSRAQAAEFIRAGRVRLNGDISRNPEAPVRMGQNMIEVDGRLVTASTKTYLMFNKPRGVITTASDEKGRETVYTLLGADLAWVAPVGRLDKASEGLLLFTNDSEWAARILAPETHLEKIYHGQIGMVADAALLDKLQKGIRTNDGDFLRVKRATILRQGGRNSWLEIVLDEGKNRHIRRMLEHLGIEVLRLVRVAIGPLALGDLPKGTHRALTQAEELSLDRALTLHLK